MFRQRRQRGRCSAMHGGHMHMLGARRPNDMCKSPGAQRASLPRQRDVYSRVGAFLFRWCGIGSSSSCSSNGLLCSRVKQFVQPQASLPAPRGPRARYTPHVRPQSRSAQSGTRCRHGPYGAYYLCVWRSPGIDRAREWFIHHSWPKRSTRDRHTCTRGSTFEVRRHSSVIRAPGGDAA